MGLSPSSREGMPLKAAPIVVCARTSLAVPANDDAQTSAMRARYGLTPRRVASSRLTAHERCEGLAQYAPHGGGALRVGLRGMAGGACVSLQAPPPKVATQVSGERDGHVVLTGMRGRNIESAHLHRAALTVLRLRLDVSILRQAQDRYVA